MGRRLHRAVSVVPSLFTLAGVFFGFAAIAYLGSDAPDSLTFACQALLVAMVFDLVDGRIARATGTQSRFGTQLDGLADMVSFGVAPALILYRWSLSSLATAGLVLAFVFVASAAIRLARFNTRAEATAPGPSPQHFSGLSTPVAAGTIVTLVLCQSSPTLGALLPGAPTTAAALVLLLSALMVSKVPYRTFKDFRPTLKTTLAAMSITSAVVGLLVILGAGFRLSSILLVGFVSYVASGPIERVILAARRHLHHGDERDADAEAGGNGLEIGNEATERGTS